MTPRNGTFGSFTMCCDHALYLGVKPLSHASANYKSFEDYRQLANFYRHQINEIAYLL